ncbi:hypothetical protein [Candidatus Caldatribacterium saccharofermentans]|uniref:hypothetical protein n=1 Tax=Candidatus Caldatribacterium saccharofermentans TaxID=1454753 RepID=UPI003D068519
MDMEDFGQIRNLLREYRSLEGAGAFFRAPGGFATFRNPVTNQHHWLFYDGEKDRIIEHRLDAIQFIRSQPHEERCRFPGTLTLSRSSKSSAAPLQPHSCCRDCPGKAPRSPAADC